MNPGTASSPASRDHHHPAATQIAAQAVLAITRRHHVFACRDFSLLLTCFRKIEKSAAELYFPYSLNLAIIKRSLSRFLFNRAHLGSANNAPSSSSSARFRVPFQDLRNKSNTIYILSLSITP